MAKRKAEPSIPTTEDVADGMADWEPGLLYVRHTANGKGAIEMHQCWQIGFFIAALEARCKEANVKRKKGDKEIGYMLSSRAEYFAERETRRGA